MIYQCKYILRLIIIPAAALCLSACQSSSTKMSVAGQEARMEMLKTAAISYSTKLALWRESQHIDQLLEAQSDVLDDIYNFRRLLLKDNLMPPVLQESHHNIRYDSSSTIRISDRYVEIVKPAVFVSVVPTWRDYLYMNYTAPEDLSHSVFPRTKTERISWNAGLLEGWRTGVWQARMIFSSNVGSITRDLKGILLYRQLLAKRMVSPTITGKASLGVTGGDYAMHLNDRILRITSQSTLSKNDQWMPAPVIEVPKTDGSFQQKAVALTKAPAATPPDDSAKAGLEPQPLWTTAQVLAWATTAAKKITSYDHRHYRNQIDGMKLYFNGTAWSEYENILSQSVSQDVAQQAVVTTLLRANPSLISQSVIDGRYTWQVSIPLLAKLQEPREIQYRELTVTMTIQQSWYDQQKVDDALILKNTSRDIGTFITRAKLFDY